MSDEKEVVPVVVTSEDGRTLALDIPLQAPIRRLCPAIEDHFKIATTSQVLSYKGDPLQMGDSLQSAGALLLAGEPYVKLGLQTSRGNNVTIIGVLPGGKELPTGVHESTKFLDLKAKLCRDGGIENPKSVRLYYRYNELVDQATLQYYRIPNHARIEVVRKPEFDLEKKRAARPKHVDTSGQERRQRLLKEKAEEAAKCVREKKVIKVPRKETPTQGNDRPASASATTSTTTSSWGKAKAAVGAGVGGKENEDLTVRQSAGRPRTANTSAATRRAASNEAAAARKSTAGSASAGASRPLSSGKLNAGGGGGTGYVSTVTPTKPRKAQHTTANRPKAYYELENAGSDDEDEDEQRFRLLQQSVAALSSGAYNGSPRKTGPRGYSGGSSDDPVMNGTIKSLKNRLEESEQRYQDALERIQELERTVERQGALLRRCVNAGFSVPPNMVPSLPESTTSAAARARKK